MNVNGWLSRQLEVTNMLTWGKLAVMAIQETLVSKHNYAIKIPGYVVYDRPKAKAFRGHALLVDESYPSYEVGNKEESQFIHIKVTKLCGNKPCHIFSLYLPSGGNFRQGRTTALNKVLAEYKKVVDKDPQAIVIILGDWNIDREDLRKRIKTDKSGLHCLPVRGSALTFHRPGIKWTAVDSIVVSPAARSHLRNAKVERHWGTSSDHFPLVSSFKPAKLEEPLLEPPVAYCFDRDKIRGFGKEIVFSNRWDKLQPGDAIFTPDQLNLRVNHFTQTINEQATESGIHCKVLERTYTYDRKLKKLLNGLEGFRKRHKQASKTGDPDIATHQRSLQMAKGEARRAIRRKQRYLRNKEIERVVGMYQAGETRRFHQWEAKNAVKGATTPKVTTSVDHPVIIKTRHCPDSNCVYYQHLNENAIIIRCLPL